MQVHQFLPIANPLLSLGAVAAGTTDTQTGAEVAMSPQYDSVIFIAMIGTITSTGLATLRAKGSNTTNTYGAGTVGCFIHADSLLTTTNGIIVQANATTGDSGLLLVIDIYRPLTAFVRPEIVRATANVVITGMIAIPYSSKYAPVTQSGVATHFTPTTGAPNANPGYDLASNPAQSLV